MTSRNLFFKLMKEDLRKRLWTIILASVVFFFAFPVASAVLIQYSLSSYGYMDMTVSVREMAANRLASYIGSGNLILALVAVVGAIICGVSGFAFLHSKKQVDFYHSLPVKRETIFFVHFVDGILIYLVPYLAGLLMTFVIAGLFKIMTGSVFLIALKGLLIHLMGYILCYLVSILATLLTGKLLLTFLGIIVFFGYAPAMYGLIMAYMEMFFTTIYSLANGIPNAVYYTRFLSPIAQYAIIVQRGNWVEFLGFVIVAVLLLFINLLLYKKRASEKAGIAMAFGITEPIFRIIISVPIGMVFGAVFLAVQRNLSETAAMIWLCVGAILGVLLTHGFIESLYRGDVKKCLSHVFQLAAELAVAVGITLCFFYDIFGHNSYLPKKEEIASMAVSSYALENNMSYYSDNGRYISKTAYELEYMELTDIDAAYELARLCSEGTVEQRKSQYSYEDKWLSRENQVTFIIKYRLENGKEVVRSYQYDRYAVMDLIAEIYRNEEYKEAFYPFYQWKEFGFIPKSVTCIRYPESLTLTLSESEQEQLMDIYIREFSMLGVQDIYCDYPVATLGVVYQAEHRDDLQDIYYTEVRGELYLYSGMKETIAFLRQHGFDVETKVDTSKISSIQIEYSVWNDRLVEEYEKYEKKEESAETYEVTGEAKNTINMTELGEGTLVVTDPEQIAECFDALVYADHSYYDTMSEYYRLFEEAYYVTVTFPIDDYGNERVFEYYFKTNQVPQFVQDFAAEVRKVKTQN